MQFKGAGPFNWLRISRILQPSIASNDTLIFLQVLRHTWTWFITLRCHQTSLTYCAIANPLLFASSTCSILFILSMTFERFYSIVVPHKAASINTVKKAKINIVTIIVFGILFNIPHIFIHEGRECVPWARGIEKVIGQFYFYSSLSINFALPFVLLLVMNSFIIHTLRTRTLITMTESENQFQNEDKASRLKNSEKQIFILLLLVTFAFLILMTPTYILILYVNLVDYTESPKSFAYYYLIFNIGHKTYYTNYGINFFLYVISGHKFRSDLLSIFRHKPKKGSQVCALPNV